MCFASQVLVRRRTRASEPGSYIASRKPASEMVSRIHRSTPRGLKAAYLTLAVITVLVAGVLPACGDGSCCANAGEPSVHTQMPCCDESSLAPREAVRLLPATSAGSVPPPQTWAPVAVVEQPGALDFIPPRVQATLATASSAHHEPHPPLFLLNAQFLI